MNRSLLITCALVMTLSACSDNKKYETAICSLIDISGTYADEKKNVVRIIKAGVLPEMVPGDSVFFITIDSNSYNEDNMKAKMTLDYRPSEANEQKLAFAKVLDDYGNSNANARYTDISGAMMLCADYLKSTKAGTQLMFIFSDMNEELSKDITREFSQEEFTGVDIAAMNVIKLNKDSSDPKVYRDRLAVWERRVSDAGAKSWRVILDPVQISDFVSSVR